MCNMTIHITFIFFTRIWPTMSAFWFLSEHVTAIYMYKWELDLSSKIRLQLCFRGSVSVLLSAILYFLYGKFLLVDLSFEISPQPPEHYNMQRLIILLNLLQQERWVMHLFQLTWTNCWMTLKNKIPHLWVNVKCLLNLFILSICIS